MPGPVPWVTLRVIAVISLAITLVSQAVSFRVRTQPAELELTMPSVTRWVCMGCQQPNLHWALGPDDHINFPQENRIFHWDRFSTRFFSLKMTDPGKVVLQYCIIDFDEK